MWKLKKVEVNDSKIHNEATFQTQIGSEWEKLGYFYDKRPDDSAGRKPFDCWVGNEHGNIACELKYMRTKNTFNFNKISPHQHTSLKRIWDNNGLACVIVYGKYQQEYKIIPYGYILELMKQKYTSVNLF